MRHVNPNAIAPVLEGIGLGEQYATEPGSAELLDQAYADIERLTAAVEPGGFRLGRTQTAKEIGRAQGFIAAYRSATEFPAERRKNAGYETLVRYWVSLGIPEGEARAAARKVHPSA